VQFKDRVFIRLHFKSGDPPPWRGGVRRKKKQPAHDLCGLPSPLVAGLGLGAAPSRQGPGSNAGGMVIDIKNDWSSSLPTYVLSSKGAVASGTQGLSVPNPIPRCCGRQGTEQPSRHP